MTEEIELEGRSIERLLSKIGKTDTEVAGLKRDIAGLAGSFENLRQSVDNLAKSRSTNWIAIFGASALCLTIAGMVGSGYIRDVSRIELSVTDLNKFATGSSSDRAALTVRLSDLERRIVELDTNLQRETRLINATTESKLVELDIRLQAELHKETDTNSNRLKLLEEYNKDSHEIHARQAEQLKQLELHRQ